MEKKVGHGKLTNTADLVIFVYRHNGLTLDLQSGGDCLTICSSVLILVLLAASNIICLQPEGSNA